MALEEIIQQILKFNPALSREEVEKLIKAKREEMGRYFTEDVLGRIVASELGVEITVNESKTRLFISDLVAGLSDVTITGRIIAVLPSLTFSRFKGATTGKLARLLIGDKTGTLNVVLWNDKAEIAKNIEQDQIVRISHGYLRESRDGALELNVGDRGGIQVLSQDQIAIADYPELPHFLTKIGSITKKQKKVHVKGIVMTLFTVSTFQRPDKTTGKLMRLELKDETGQIRVSVWNEKVDELANIRLGANLQVMNARVKQGLDKKLELHVETSSQMSLLAEEWMKTPIAKLQASMGSVTIIGTVISKPFFREVTTSKGEKVGLTTFELQDATGKIWVSAWRKHAEITQNLAVGEEIEIKDGYVKKGFSDQLEVSTRATTSIQILSKQEEGY